MCFPQTHFLRKITSKKKSILAAKQNDALRKKVELCLWWRVFCFFHLGNVLISEVVSGTLEAGRRLSDYFCQ